MIKALKQFAQALSMLPKKQRDAIKAMASRQNKDAQAKIYDFIEKETGQRPPEGHIESHPDDFQMKDTPTGNGGFTRIWTWKDRPVVKQTGRFWRGSNKIEGEWSTEIITG